MARGFESKDVEFQQAEADRGRASGKTLTPEARQREDKRRTLELSLSKLRSDRASAAHPRHRQMLDEAIGAIEQQLRDMLPNH